MPTPFEWTITGSERFVVQVDVQLTGHLGDGKGVVLDMGLKGAQIVTDVPVILNDRLHLTFLLPTPFDPVDIEFGVVRWLVGERFGVEFLTMDTKAFRQLALYLSGVKHAAQPQPATELAA